jgi:TRAP-type mannitol/chloroaromatic compound transport system permease small subunit
MPEQSRRLACRSRRRLAEKVAVSALDIAGHTSHVAVQQALTGVTGGGTFMAVLLRISGAIDRGTAFIGQSVTWLILLSVLVSAGNATSRKLFSLSSNAWLELQWYLFAAAYLLAAAYTLQRNGHVRIDIVSNVLPRRVRNWIDIFGHAVMLLPFTLLMIWEATPWFVRSYRLGEVSENYGGLILWPAKGLLLAGFFLLAIQAVSELIKRIAVMQGRIPDPDDRTQSQTSMR